MRDSLILKTIKATRMRVVRRSHSDSLPVPLIFVAVITFLMSGCSGSSTPPAPSEYTPPGWMAEKAARNELHRNLLQECITEAGLPDKVDRGSGSRFKYPEDMSLAEQLALSKSRNKAISNCQNEVMAQMPPEPEIRPEKSYERMTQTAECLRANGYSDLEQAPSMSVWIDENWNWSPYEALYEAHPDITEDEWFDLKAVCVEGAINYRPDFSEPPPEFGGS